MCVRHGLEWHSEWRHSENNSFGQALSEEANNLCVRFGTWLLPMWSLYPLSQRIQILLTPGGDVSDHLYLYFYNQLSNLFWLILGQQFCLSLWVTMCVWRGNPLPLSTQSQLVLTQLWEGFFFQAVFQSTMGQFWCMLSSIISVCCLDIHLSPHSNFLRAPTSPCEKGEMTDYSLNISKQHVTTSHTTPTHDWLVARPCPRAAGFELSWHKPPCRTLITLHSSSIVCLNGVEHPSRKAVNKTHTLPLCFIATSMVFWAEIVDFPANYISTAAKSLCIAICYLASSTEASQWCPKWFPASSTFGNVRCLHTLVLSWRR